MELIKEAFESNYIAPLGPQVDALEREFGEYVGMKHCAAVSSDPQITQITRINGRKKAQETQK